MEGVYVTIFHSNKNCNDADVFAVSFIFLFPYRMVLFFWFGLWSLEYWTFFTTFHCFNLSFFPFSFCRVTEWQGWKFGNFVYVLSNGG